MRFDTPPMGPGARRAGVAAAVAVGTPEGVEVVDRRGPGRRRAEEGVDRDRVHRIQARMDRPGAGRRRDVRRVGRRLAQVDLVVDHRLIHVGQDRRQVRRGDVRDRRLRVGVGVGRVQVGLVHRQPLGRQVGVGALEVERRQAELLEVVDALRPPGRLAPACTAGNSSAISTEMIAMTTRSSIRVKPDGRTVRLRTRLIGESPKSGTRNLPHRWILRGDNNSAAIRFAVQSASSKAASWFGSALTSAVSKGLLMLK